MAPRALLLVAALAWETSIAFRAKHRKKDRHGEWITGDVPAAKVVQRAGLEFHGSFRDLALWKDTSMASRPSSLWVIEFEHHEEVDQERARAESLGLEVLFRRQQSLVVEGDVPKKLGYDACGGNGNKTVVPVADYEVTPRAMPRLDVEKYTKLAQTRDLKNVEIRSRSTRSTVRATLEKLEGFGDRHSYRGEGSGLDQAAEWAAKELEKFGFTVTRDDFQPGGGSWWSPRRITPQIVAEVRGTENPDRIVVMGAHLDSTSSRGDAPGADDNGSGSTVILELARLISEGGVTFKNTLRLCLFTGEEQGLLGSRALARRWKREGVDIVAMLNADMVGYRQPGEPITLALMSRNADQDMVNIVKTATETYLAGDLEIGYTSGCCSDQQSFYENGFPAMGIFENPGSRVYYPHYHKNTDQSKWLEVEQIELLGQAYMAAALLFSEIDEQPMLAYGAEERHGEWLATEVVQKRALSERTGREFHGSFRDLALWKDTAMAARPNSLWVIEFEHQEDVESERKHAESLGLEVLFRRERTLVVSGDASKKLGYDACGGDGKKTVVPVADYEVTPSTMPRLDVEKYTKLAQTRDERNIALRNISTRSSVRATLEHLESYGDRHSYGGVGRGLDQAADWAAKELEKFGFAVTRDDFRPEGRWPWSPSRITPQIVAEIRGTENPDRVVVMGAHLDSTSSGGNAPGADDNGSGSTVILELARLIHEGGASFKNTLRLCLFTGEEQGLLGSRALARKWKSEGVDIIAMLNADMVGYRQPGEPITLALMNRNADQDMVNIVKTSTETYLAGELEIGYTSGCCSDQQSFYENGFPAMGIFENPGSRVYYPHYHKSTDQSKWLEVEQIEKLGQAYMAAALLFSELAE